MTDPDLVPDAEIPAQFGFHVAGTLFLVPAACVEAVASYDAPIPLPRVAPHIVGLVTYDQRALVLLDLARFLGLGQDEVREARRTLVVATGAYRVGIPGEHAQGVMDVKGLRSSRGAMAIGGRAAEFVRAEVDTPIGLAAMLDVDALLDAARA